MEWGCRSMRVTNKTMLNNYLQNLNRNLNQMAKSQNQLSSGKEISKPSDDPFAVTRSMSLHTSINQNNQYLRNIEDSLGWVDMTDSALGGIGDILNRVRELTIKGANGSLSGTDRKAIQDEMEQLVGQVAQIGNSNYDGRYIFGGQKTTEAPFKVGEEGYILEYTGDQGKLKREISQNVTMEVNVPGDWIMEGKNAIGDSLSKTLKEIVEALDTGDNSQLGGELLGKLDGHIDNLLSLRSEVGAKSNRLEAAQTKNKDETLSMTELMSKTEDIDIAEKTMQHLMMQNVYMASLATGAKIMQPSLLDFLR